MDTASGLTWATSRRSHQGLSSTGHQRRQPNRFGETESSPCPATSSILSKARRWPTESGGATDRPSFSLSTRSWRPSRESPSFALSKESGWCRACLPTRFPRTCGAEDPTREPRVARAADGGIAIVEALACRVPPLELGETLFLPDCSYEAAARPPRNTPLIRRDATAVTSSCQSLPFRQRHRDVMPGRQPPGTRCRQGRPSAAIHR